MSNLKKEFKKVLDQEVEIAISDEQIDYMFSWFLSRLKEEARIMEEEFDVDETGDFTEDSARVRERKAFRFALSQLLKRMGVEE